MGTKTYDTFYDTDPAFSEQLAEEMMNSVIVGLRLFLAWAASCPAETRGSLETLYGVAAAEMNAGRLRNVDEIDVHIARRFATKPKAILDIGTDAMLKFAKAYHKLPNPYRRDC